jgi:thiamine-phosphate pyrophosphorylase
VLGLAGIRELLPRLGDLPAWVIGGVEAADLPPVLAAGAAGAAVSSALFRGGRVEDNLRDFLAAAGPGGPAGSPAGNRTAGGGASGPTGSHPQVAAPIATASACSA